MLLSGHLAAQDFGNQKVKKVALLADTISIDTLSIIPGSFQVSPQIDSSLFNINFGASLLILKNRSVIKIDSLSLEYRVFPMLFERKYFHKDYQKLLSPDSLMGKESMRYTISGEPENIFGDNVQTSGSFTRGIGFGNNQDITVNSAMNIRLNGELGSGLMIEGAISDQAIPLQPQGNTRKLEEFDRIYLRVYKQNFSLQAGDIEMAKSGGNLLSFSRNVQGLAYKGFVSKPKKNDSLVVEALASVAKGKFARNQISGIEGNQGPYRLHGSEGEIFIIILSGSERVYVDGILLTRGEDFDYVIDYNVAEISFTPKIMINGNSRISVEFEYSERSYARFTTYAGVQHFANKWNWRFSAFSEMDAKNQPYDQELSEDQKRLMALIGDSIQMAYIPQVDSVEFNPEIILYQKLDTLVNGSNYIIFRHSTNPDLANFRVYFSYVGEGNGNYAPSFGDANGRVFKWVAPMNGIRQGNYEPIRRLVTPKKKQMITGGVERYWANSSGVKIDYALSNTDLNTFSSEDAEDNIGHALKTSIFHEIGLKKQNSTLRFGGDLLKTSSSFRTIDRFREVEFEREWSIENALNGRDEQQVGAWLELNIPQASFVKISGESLNLGQNYRGIKGTFSGWQQLGGFKVNWNGLMTNASDTTIKSSFTKAKVGLTKQFWLLKMALESEFENRNSSIKENDSLAPNSFQWYSLKAVFSTPDSFPQRFIASYLNRTDYKPISNSFQKNSASQEVSFTGLVEGRKLGNLSLTLGYRNFNPIQPNITQLENKENTFLSRIEYSTRFLKGGLIMSGGYELGSGQEPKYEYYFIEVPAGQGLFAWIDYNANGIKELDEFEIARFSDEAKYIRINMLGQKTVAVKTNAFSFRSSINPASFIKGKGVVSNQLGKFSDQLNYSIHQKNRYSNFLQSANPFSFNPTDSLLNSLSESLRNSLAYNRSNRKFGSEYIFTSTKSKVFLANGFELKDFKAHRLIFWLGFKSTFFLKIEGEKSSSSNLSEFFDTRNFNLNGIESSASLKYSGVKNLTIETTYKWSDAENEYGSERAKIQTITLQSDYSFPGKSSLMGKFSHVDNTFSGQSGTPVAYDMLKGLQPGKNWLWELAVKQKLSTYFELELGYNGRMQNNGKIIHTGSMQARALF